MNGAVSGLGIFIGIRSWGELVGWIKRRLLFLMLVSKKDGETKVQKTFDFI